jgi:hypothetical protein
MEDTQTGIVILLRTFKIFNELFRTAPPHGVTPVTVCITIDALGFSQSLDRLRSLWTKLHGVGFKLSENCWLSYIEALIRCGQKEEAQSLFREMQSTFKNPTLKTLTNYVQMMGDERIAEEVQAEFNVEVKHKPRRSLVIPQQLETDEWELKRLCTLLTAPMIKTHSSK